MKRIRPLISLLSACSILLSGFMSLIFHCLMFSMIAGFFCFVFKWFCGYLWKHGFENGNGSRMLYGGVMEGDAMWCDFNGLLAVLVLGWSCCC